MPLHNYNKLVFAELDKRKNSVNVQTLKVLDPSNDNNKQCRSKKEYSSLTL